MAGRRDAGLVAERLHRAEMLELSSDLLEVGLGLPRFLQVEFVFDFQARPHVVLAIKALTGPALGVSHKPSYWDLPLGLQTLLLERQLAVANELSALRLEVHLGSWVSGRHIHAHIVLPLRPYFELRALGGDASKASWTPKDVQWRAQYVAKTQRDHARFHAQDGPIAHQAATSGLPQREANLSEFDAVVFDADGSGTAAIDLVFKGSPAVKSMTRAELRGALQAVGKLCKDLMLDGAHLLLPAPAVGVPDKDVGINDRAQAHQDCAARLVIRADLFVLCLPPDKRLDWHKRWAKGDPIARSYKEDMSSLSLAEGVTGASSSAPPTSTAGGGHFTPHKRKL